MVSFVPFYYQNFRNDKKKRNKQTNKTPQKMDSIIYWKKKFLQENKVDIELSLSALCFQEY